MFVERENSMLLEGRRNLLDDESCPQLTKYLHKHDRPHFLNRVRSSLRDGNDPFPFPSVRGMVLSPHGNQAIIGFRDHGGGPVLNLFVLEPGGAARGVPCLVVQDYRELIQGGWGREEILEVGLNPVPPRGRRSARQSTWSVSGRSPLLRGTFNEE